MEQSRSITQLKIAQNPNMKVARSSMLRMPNFKPAKETEPKLTKIEALKGEYKTFMQS